MGKLTALKIKSAPPGRHADGDGLHLIVRETGSRQWLLRIQAEGKRRDLGLGTAETISRTKGAQAEAEGIPILERRSLTLAEARDKADAFRRMVKAGIDPVAEREKRPAAIPTFEKAVRACHDQLKAGWRNKRHQDGWLASLITYICPTIGEKPINSITSINVRDALAPIWLTKPETAQRVLQRIGVVLDFAHINGWRPDETSLKSVRKGLPRQPQNETHFEAMPYADVPAFMQKLATAEATVGRDALQFTILNAVRSNETRFAVWPEFDLDEAIWTIPAERMKMKKKHVVPLSPASVAVLRRRWAGRSANDGMVFFTTPAKPISDMTMTKVLRDDGIKKITVHGFRSSFTDWAAEETKVRKEVVDKALAHKVPDKVEAAYRRTDFFERRKQLMKMWADYLGGVSNVMRLAAVA